MRKVGLGTSKSPWHDTTVAWLRIVIPGTLPPSRACQAIITAPMEMPGATALRGHTLQSASESPTGHGFAWSYLPNRHPMTPVERLPNRHWHKASGQTNKHTHTHTHTHTDTRSIMSVGALLGPTGPRLGQQGVTRGALAGLYEKNREVPITRLGPRLGQQTHGRMAIDVSRSVSAKMVKWIKVCVSMETPPPHLTRKRLRSVYTKTIRRRY